MAEAEGRAGLPRAIQQLLIQVLGDQREGLIEHAILRGHGLEIADFAASEILDDTARCAELMAWYRERLPSVRGLVGFHGAFRELLPAATDSKIRAATASRVRQSLDIAEELGVTCAVFHSGHDLVNLAPDYLLRWAERQGAFWRGLMAGRSITLLLENALEPGPQALAVAMDAIGLDSVGICYDPAHAYLRSIPLGSAEWAPRLQGTPPEEWAAVLGARIRYLHLSDNDRAHDHHAALGRGSMDWPTILRAIGEAGLSLPAAIEVEGVEGARATEEYLHSLKKVLDHSDSEQNPICPKNALRTGVSGCEPGDRDSSDTRQSVRGGMA